MTTATIRPTAEPTAVGDWVADHAPADVAGVRSFLAANHLFRDAQQTVELARDVFPPGCVVTLSVDRNPDDESPVLTVNIRTPSDASTATQHYYRLVERWVAVTAAAVRERICLLVLVA